MVSVDMQAPNELKPEWSQKNDNRLPQNQDKTWQQWSPTSSYSLGMGQSDNKMVWWTINT